MAVQIDDEPDQAARRPGRRLVWGIAATGLGTLASRVLGLLRDMATASLLGMSAGGVLDAFVVAMRVPNFFRRLVGEGALSAGYVPVLTQAAELGPRTAWALASVVLYWVMIAATAVIVACEAICGLAWLTAGERRGVALLAGLSATMLPYVVCVCIASILVSTLHVWGRFSLAALAPSLLNVSMLTAAWFVAPRVAGAETRAYVLAVAVAGAGLLQLALLWPAIRQLGFRWNYDWPVAREGFWHAARATVPMVLGLAVTQINTLLDSLLAWSLTAPSSGSDTISWLGNRWHYPLSPGAAAALYYGERLYQFPVGMLGIAVATVIFPLLARHAARGERARIGDDLTSGLRLVLFFGLPASVGLVMLAEPISRLLLERGEFTADDAQRTARMIACYGAGAWAYCAIPVVVRGFYAIGDRTTPVRLGMLIVVVDLATNLTLVWPLAELGLAGGTTLTAVLQAATLVCLFSTFHVPLAWRLLAATVARGLAATGLMATVVAWALAALPDMQGTAAQAARMALPAAAGAAVFLLCGWFMGGQELRLLARRQF